MRIGVISDLHVDLNGGEAGPRTYAGYLSDAARAKGVELLLIAGDLSNRWDLTLRTLEEIQERAAVRVLFVPGNLARGPVELPGGWAVAGAMGWYDFAFGHPRFSPRAVRADAPRGAAVAGPD